MLLLYSQHPLPYSHHAEDPITLETKIQRRLPAFISFISSLILTVTLTLFLSESKQDFKLLSSF